MRVSGVNEVDEGMMVDETAEMRRRKTKREGMQTETEESWSDLENKSNRNG